MSNASLLIEALKRCRPKWANHIHYNEEKPFDLYGFQGDNRTQATGSNHSPPCQIMVPGAGSSKRNMANAVGGASNDIGFTRSSDGTFELKLSSYDIGQHPTLQKEVETEYNVLDAQNTISNNPACKITSAPQLYEYKGKKVKGFEVEVDEDMLQQNKKQKQLRVI